MTIPDAEAKHCEVIFDFVSQLKSYPMVGPSPKSASIPVLRAQTKVRTRVCPWQGPTLFQLWGAGGDVEVGPCPQGASNQMQEAHLSNLPNDTDRLGRLQGGDGIWM